MADVSYDIQVRIAQAVNNLNTLQAKVGSLGQAFSDLAQIVAGAGFVAAAMKAIQYADAIQDIADASGLAVANVTAFSDVVQMSGGSAEGAQRMILRLADTFQDAADGSKTAQMAFIKAGISLKELGTLTDEQLLARTIQGLAGISDASLRVATAQKLLGKEARAVNWASVSGGYASAVMEARRYSDSLKAAADAQNQLDMAVNKIRISLLTSLKPLLDWINGLKPEQIDRMANAFVQLATSVAAISTAMVAVSGFVRVMGALAVAYASAKVGMLAFSAGLSTTVAGVSSLARTFGIAYGYLDRFVRGVGMFAAANGTISNTITLFGKLGARIAYLVSSLGLFGRGIALMAVGLVRMIPYIGTIIAGLYAMDAALEVLTGRGLRSWFESLAGWLEGLATEYFPTLTKAINDLNAKLGLGMTPSERAAQDQRLKNIDDLRKFERAAADEQSAADQRKLEMQRKIRTDLENFRREQEQIVASYAQGNSDLAQRIKFETSLIGKSEDEREILQARENILNNQVGIIRDLIKQQDKLKLEVDTDPTAAAKIAVITETIKKLWRETGFAQDSVEELTRANQSARLVEQARQRDLENLTRAIEDQINRQNALADSLRSINDQRVNLQFETGMMDLSPYQQQIAQINESARTAALEAGRAYAQAFEDTGDGLTPERAQQLANGLDQIAQGYAAIAAQQIANLEKSRTAEFGLNKAFKEFKDTVTNDAAYMEGIFNTMTQGFSDAFVQFVQTGKLSFKSLANSMLAEVTKMAANRLFLSLFGGMFGGTGGNIFGSILGSLFGGFKAGGGSVAANKAYVVGERGPELFVPQNAGRIVPNGAMTAQPQPIIQNTSVNYSIQAVDASSFRSLVARDPEFIYSVTEQGRRQLPIRSRR